ncbi:MAG TPA: type IV pili twitching motility protein PilT, partial [Actinoplanes sp.]|nr:type IV pili twitching motility protein PilT [Actinoplanes sp.]
MSQTDLMVPSHAASAEPPASGDLSVLNQMLVTLVESRGSDLHLTVGTPPMIRVNGALRPIEGYGNLNSDDTALLARAAVSADQWATFQHDRELDFAHSIVGVSRFRGNLYVQRTSCGAVFRAIPHEIKPLDELGMPDSVARFAHLPRGLVLVT